MRLNRPIIVIPVAVILTIVAVLAWVGRRWRQVQGGSRAVAAWSPSVSEPIQLGPLTAVRIGTDEPEEVVVLLHGLASSAVYFGGHWERLAGPRRAVLVPDLLGFGDSLDATLPASAHSLDQHIEALTGMLEAAGADTARLHLVGHSMGSVVALALADRHLDRVASVTLIAPTLHDSVDEFLRHITIRGAFVRWFGTDRRAARNLSRLISNRPRVASFISRFAAPAMPRQIANRSGLHSWNSYIGTLRSVSRDRTWRRSLQRLAEQGTPVQLLVGGHDHTIDQHLVRDLATAHRFHAAEARFAPALSLHVLSDHGHQLPLTAPEACVDHVRALVS